MSRHRITTLALAALLTGMTAACGGSSTPHSAAAAAADSSVVYAAPTAAADACNVLAYQAFAQLTGPVDTSGPNFDKLGTTADEQGVACYKSFNPPTGSTASIMQTRTDLSFWKDAATAREEVQSGDSTAGQDPKSAVAQVSGVGSEAYHFIRKDFGSGLLEVVLDAGVGNLELQVQVDTQRPTDWTADQLAGLYTMMADYAKQNLSAVQKASSTWGAAGKGASTPSS